MRDSYIDTDDIYTDSFGHEYESLDEMCSAYGISRGTYEARLNAGWDEEEALIVPVHDPRNIGKGQDVSVEPIKDHLGNTYSSIRKMCDAYGINHATYQCRIKQGWSQKDALTIKPGSILFNKGSSRTVSDHLGNRYASMAEMCRAYNIPSRTLKDRLKRGFSLEEALTMDKQCGKRVTYDHLGNRFESQNAMLRHYGISKGTFQGRMRYGWDLKDALTVKSDDHCGKMLSKSDGIIEDYNGKQFSSFKEMCAYHGVGYSAFRSRYRDRGYTLREALDPNPKIATEAYDHLGNRYANNREMCAAYGISEKLFEKRIYEYHWTKEEALTLPKNMYIGEHRVAECLKRLNIKFYHDCTIKTIFKDLDIRIDWDVFLTELQSKLDNAGHKWSRAKIARLRPDFVLYTDDDDKIRGVIEFDGEQHQNFVEFFFKTIEEFFKRSDVDFVKQGLWEYMNIPMLRIRYDQVDMIDDIVKDFVDNPKKYIKNHNTYLSEEEYWEPLKKEKERIEATFA